jgi:hypothetical protein
MLHLCSSVYKSYLCSPGSWDLLKIKGFARDFFFYSSRAADFGLLERHFGISGLHIHIVKYL